MEIIGSGLSFTADLGNLSGYLLSHGPSWLYHLIIFSECRQDIIGYTTVTSIAIGGIGVIITTGTDSLGIENMPSIIGVEESFIGPQKFIIRISTMVEKFITAKSPVTRVGRIQEVK
jgi:hypothetical protein